jgi:hypothetical protein
MLAANPVLAIVHALRQRIRARIRFLITYNLGAKYLFKVYPKTLFSQ